MLVSVTELSRGRCLLLLRYILSLYIQIETQLAHDLFGAAHVEEDLVCKRAGAPLRCAVTVPALQATMPTSSLCKKIIAKNQSFQILDTVLPFPGHLWSRNNTYIVFEVSRLSELFSSPAYTHFCNLLQRCRKFVRCTKQERFRSKQGRYNVS
jgi:hypothetical protein